MNSNVPLNTRNVDILNRESITRSQFMLTLNGRGKGCNAGC